METQKVKLPTENFLIYAPVIYYRIRVHETRTTGIQIMIIDIYLKLFTLPVCGQQTRINFTLAHKWIDSITMPVDGSWNFEFLMNCSDELEKFQWNSSISYLFTLVQWPAIWMSDVDTYVQEEKEISIHFRAIDIRSMTEVKPFLRR